MVHRAELYLATLNNYLASCLSQPDYHDRFLAQMALVRQQRAISPPIQLRFERVTYIQQLALRLNFHRLQDAADFIQDISTWLDQKADHLDAAGLLHCYHNLSIYHFVYGAFAASKQWVRKILNFPATDMRQDIQDFARILELVLLAERGNFDLQEYLVRNTERHLRQSGKLKDLHAAVLQWLKQSHRLPGHSSAAHHTLLAALAETLHSLADSTTGRPPIGLRELILWVESKLAGEALGVYFMRRMFG
jgi:hypothetical protein